VNATSGEPHELTVSSAVFVATGIVVTVYVVAWFVRTAKRAETLASYLGELPDTPSERFYGPHPFGPAGPDAESQRPEDTGNAWDPPPPRRRRSRHGRRRRRCP
jgi:hypothetical protein